MIPKYISSWIDIIEGMRNNNTYKLAWGRAILELVNERSSLEQKREEFNLSEVAEKILKLYWNQTFYFRLKQGPSNSEPEILQIIQDLIRYYTLKVGSNIPVWFNVAAPILKSDNSKYERTIKKLIRILKQDVAYRFKNLDGHHIDLYAYNSNQNLIVINIENQEMLKEYNYILSQLLNYRWSQLLESFNRAPNITNKVKGSSQEKINRKNLKKFRDILLNLIDESQITDFYSNDTIQIDDVSIDHFIPWSFMYQDDLWNLVITSKSHNSAKSNKIYPDDFLVKLNERNKKIIKYLPKESLEYLKLQEAIENDYPNSFYYDFKNSISN